MPTITLSTERHRWEGQSLRGATLGFVAAVICFFTGCDFPGRPSPADRPVPADQVLSFSILYGRNCSGCHGANGKLGPAPPLNDNIFRAIMPLAEIENIVTHGRHDTLMPAFAKDHGGALTTAQIQVLIHEIKGIRYKVITKQEDELASAEVVADAEGISPTWGPVAALPAGAPTYQLTATNADGIGSESSRRGETVFARACAACHGSGGHGVVKESKTLRAINDPVTLRLMSDQLLRRYIITGRPDFGMPNFAEPRPDNAHFQPLTDHEITDLVALLASWRESVIRNHLAQDKL